MASNPDVLIIGAGLAGLSCARNLADAGISFQILESSDGIGGRVRTDEVEGFLLDRGFQVLLTAYPEAKLTLDYQALDLKPFATGAFSWYAGRMHKLVDPWRVPGAWLEALLSDFGTFRDKLGLGLMRRRLKRESIDDIFRRPERTTKEALLAGYFSAEFIHRFFRPFFGGILLDGELNSSSRMLEFVFKMLSEGDTAVPSRGMSAIPDQLAAKLPVNSIRLNTKVQSLKEHAVHLIGGEMLRARAIVIAAEGPSAAHLLGEPEAASRSVTCVYYCADESPMPFPMLVLNGDGDGMVNNLSVMTQIAPSYGPPGKHLISATVLGNSQLTDEDLNGYVIAQMKQWFGGLPISWGFLKSYRIAHAQPQQFPGALEPPERTVRLSSGLYVCGDHRDNGSINGALRSGRRAAKAVITDLSD